MVKIRPAFALGLSLRRNQYGNGSSSICPRRFFGAVQPRFYPSGARGNPDFHSGNGTNFFASTMKMVSSHGILKAFPCTDRVRNCIQASSDGG
jgi:hypothetical protein